MSTHTLRVEVDSSQLRLDVYLAQVLPDIPSRSFVKKLITSGSVKIDGKKVTPHFKVNEGDEIVVHIPEKPMDSTLLEAENIPIDIFYEDEDLLIVNKAAGMVVHPARGNSRGTLVNALLHHCNQLSDYQSTNRPGIVHRLDQDTSGVLIIAKNNKAHARLARQFQKKTVKKQYLAIVEGEIEFDEGVIDAPLGRHYRFREKRDVQYDHTSKDAQTYYRVIKRCKGVTLVNLYPKTGRTHQLRVHMAYLKHPVLGDEKYGHKKTFPRLALHAQSIGFVHPTKKRYVEFCSKTPQEFLSKVQGAT